MLLDHVNAALARSAMDAARADWPVKIIEAAQTVGGVTASVAAKDSNPKDAIGSAKVPLDMVPDSLSFFAAMSFYEGATKYGAYNWRFAGVRASIYKAALERHLKKWWNGEECDPKTKVPHLASVIACAAIILDAELVGKLEDDRPPSADLAALAEKVEGVAAHLRELHKGMNPVHYTQKLLASATEQ